MKKIALIFLFAVVVNSIYSQPTQPQVNSPEQPLWQTGKLYVKIDNNSNLDLSTYPSISNQDLAAVMTQYGVTNVEKPFAALNTPKFNRTYRFTFTDTLNTDSFIIDLQGINDIEYAEKVPMMYPQIIPNDPLLGSQYYWNMINADGASNIYQTNPGASGNTIVAIVDDAVMTTHEDLTANIFSLNRDVADLDNDPNPPFSGAAATNGTRFSHGTHVAGIAGAETNNLIPTGVASVGWSNYIMGIKTRKSNDPGNGLPFAWDGVVWAIANNARVINMSWGGAPASITEYNILLTAQSQDIVLVAAAGNSGMGTAFYPAAYGEGATGQSWEVYDRTLVISVAALDANNDRSVWTGGFGTPGSNFGAWVDIAAYGTAIRSSISNSSFGSPIINQYADYDGTSMAAPMVSGVVGIMRSYNSTATAVDIYNCLVYSANIDIYGSAHPNNILGTLGYGRLDAEASLQCLGVPCSNNPIAVISPSSINICPGGTVTLTANQGIAYSWSTGATTQSITVSASGIYTVTVTFPGGCTDVASITINNVNPNLNINIFENSGNPNDGIMCGPGSSSNAFSFCASATGSSYSWSPFGFMNWGQCTGVISMGSTVPSSFTMTVTVTDMEGCVGLNGTASFTVTSVNPPTVTVTPSITTICQGQSTTLTASGASTYVWSPAIGLSSTTGATVTASPSTTTTYTVTGTDVNGCTATSNVTVTVDPNCCGSLCNPLPAPSGILSATPPPFQNYCINNNITVTGNVALFLSEFQIDPNVTITVDNNAVLTITGSHLYACDKMWQGIVVKPGGRVVVQSFVLGNFINRSSLIEDAFIAIDVQGDPLINNNPLTVTDATFNRNEISIQITDYSTIIGATTYPMSVINTVFTSRDIPFTPGSLIWPNTNAIKATTPVPVLQSPYINNATYSPSNVNAYLKLPFIAGTRKPLAGIRLIRVGNTQTPLTPIYHEIKIGAPGKPKFNVFDNLLIGIDAHSTNFTCVNNVFQNNPDNQKLAVAINAIAENLTNNRLRVIPAAGKNFANRFYDVGRAINSIDYYENIATHCDVRSSWNTTAPFTSPPVFNGKHGFIIQTNRFKMVNFSNNSMYNIENGITFFGNFGPFQGGGPIFNGQYSGQINIINNTIRPHLPGNTVTTQYVANAISVSNVVNSNIFFLPNSTINVNNNTLTEVYRGIGISTWTKKDVKTNNNTISLVEDAFTATNPTPLQYGIAHQANRAATNFGNSIAENLVNGFGITGSVVSGNPNVRAIVTVLCGNQVVRCNTVNNTFKGIEFRGDNFPTSFTKNHMTTHRYGFVLDNAGFIGVQGNTTSPTDNRWLGTWTTPNFKTATLANPTASTAVGSELWVRQSPAVFNPNGSGFSPIPANIYSNSNGTLLYTTVNPPTTACPPVVCCIGQNQVLRLEQVVQELDPLVNNIAETRYINKNKVYRMLRDDPTLQNGSTILQNFYATKQQSNSETMAAVEEDFMLPDVFAAQAKTSGMMATNNIEQNYLTFFESYIKHQTDTINASDSLTLRTLAMGCPFTDGEVVYQARALFNAIYMSNVIFEDGCSSGNARMMGFTENSVNTASTDLQVTIYPNPTTGETTLLIEGDENEWFIAVSDIQGRKIHEKTYTTNKINLKLEADNGVYFVHITNNSTNETITKKLIINK